MQGRGQQAGSEAGWTPTQKQARACVSPALAPEGGAVGAVTRETSVGLPVLVPGDSRGRAAQGPSAWRPFLSGGSWREAQSWGRGSSAVPMPHAMQGSPREALGGRVAHC